MTTECYWCGQCIEDGSEESGYTGPNPDWCADGDYGCDRNPLSGPDGVGAHLSRDEARAIVTATQAACEAIGVETARAAWTLMQGAPR